MIKATNLSKTYKNGFKAVKSINLNIKEGDIYGFLGPNGAGKTTTIRMLTGLLKPTTGEVFIGGIKVDGNQQKTKQMIGVLPESHGYYEWMTAYEYLNYFYKLYDMDKDNAKQHIDYLLHKVGLTDRSHTLVGQFSRGMRQRLGIAKTLINRPKIIFLDEPTLGLDPTGQRDIHELIKSLNKSLNITVFITSHLLKDIEVLCNKVAIVKNGELIVEDSIINLQERFTEGEIINFKTSDQVKAENLVSSILHAEVIANNSEGMKVKIDEPVNVNSVKQKIVEVLFMHQIDIYEITKQITTIEDIFIQLVTNESEKEAM